MVSECPLKLEILNCRVLSTLLADISSSVVVASVTATPGDDAPEAVAGKGWLTAVPADESAAFAADAMPANPMRIDAAATVDMTLGAVRMDIGSLRTLLAGRSGDKRARTRRMSGHSVNKR